MSLAFQAIGILLNLVAHGPLSIANGNWTVYVLQWAQYSRFGVTRMMGPAGVHKTA